MTIQVVCECGFNKQVPDEWVGKKVKCKCGRSFVVGETLADQAAGEAPPAAAQPAPAAPDQPKPSQPKAAESKPAASAAAQPKPPKSPTAPTPTPTTSAVQAAQPAADQLDLSDLLAGESAGEPSPIMQAIDEFDEVAVGGKGKLDMLDLLEELDMSEGGADELDMSEGAVEDLDMFESPEPAARISPTAAKPAPVPVPAKPVSKPAVAAAPAQAPAAAKPAPPAAKPRAASPAKPAASAGSAPAAPAKPLKPSKPASQAQPAVDKQSAAALPVTPDPLMADPLMAEALIAEPITAQASGAVPTQTDPSGFTAGPAHVTGDIHIAAPEAAPVPKVAAIPAISVSRADAATPSATALASRQKAKRKSDIVKLTVLGIGAFVTLMIFGCIFGLGVLLHRFDDPKKAQDEENQVQPVQTPVTTPAVVDEQPAQPEVPATTDDTKTDDTKTDETKTEE